MTVGKLRKVIKKELDFENVDIERVHSVKRNTHDNDIDERNSKLPTVVAKF